MIPVPAVREVKSSPASTVSLGAVLDGVLALLAGSGVLLVAIWISGRMSEDFTDTFTGSMAFGGRGDKRVEILGALLAIAAGVASHEGARAVRRRFDSSRRDPILHKTSISTGALPETSLPLLGAALTICWALGSVLLSAGMTTVLGAVGAVPPMGVVPLLSATGVSGCMLLGARPFEEANFRLLGALAAGQACFFGGIFMILPPPILGGNGQGYVVRNWAGPITWVLVVFVAGLIVSAAYWRWHALKRTCRSVTRLSDALVGPAVVVGAFALRSTVPVPDVSADSYHFGELVTPLSLWNGFGQVPYSDQLPARGVLVNYLPAWLSGRLTHDWVGLIPVGSAALALLVLSAAFWLFREYVGTGWATLLTVFAGLVVPDKTGVIDLVMVLFLLAMARNIRTANLALTTSLFALTSTTAILLSPAQGLTLLAAGVAMLGTRIIQRPPSLKQVASAIAAFGVLSLAVLISPIWEPLKAATGYVLAQGSVNDQVWGIAWVDSFPSLHGVGLFPTVVAELLRAGALAGIGVIVIVCIRFAGRVRTVGEYPLWIGLGTYSTLQLPRALGRIGAFELSRIGLLTLVVLGFVVPIVLLSKSRQTSWRAVALPLIAALTLALELNAQHLGPEFGPGSFRPLIERATSISRDPGLTPVLSEPGLAALSRAVVPPQLISQVSTTAFQYENLLPPGSPRELLDLTNAQADFRYLGVDNPLDTAAVFNITSEGAEFESLRRLNQRQPALALLWHAQAVNHDGGGLGLRTPVIFEWVVENYIPVECGTRGEPGYTIWGVRQPREVEGCQLAKTEAEKAALFAWAFSPPKNLAALPRAWASTRSHVLEVLGGREAVTPLVISTDSATTVDVPLPGSGSRSGILSVDVDCGSWVSGTVSWKHTSTSARGTVALLLGAGPVLIPLDAFPSFRLASGLETIQIDIPGASSCHIGPGTSWMSRNRTTQAIESGLVEQ